MSNATHYSIIPWQPSCIPESIQKELNRRKTNRSFNYIDNSQANWDVNGDWSSYKGPMTSWIRFCSNGAGHPLVKKERFILNSGKGFYQSYGFSKIQNNSNFQQIIGYTPGDFENEDFGEPHIIENSLNAPDVHQQEGSGNWPIHVPPPEVSRLDVVIQKELYRRATIEWVCFSWKQLVYMTPYFLVPGITCIVEWGWNNYNIQSLVNLGDKFELRQLWDNAYPLYTSNILKSNGNYDVIYGMITNFNWSIEGNKIICTTEITSKDRLYSGISKNIGLSVRDIDKNTTGGIFKSLKDFISDSDTIKNLKSLIYVDSSQTINGKIIQIPNVKANVISLSKTNTNNDIWIDILSSLLNKNTDETSEQHAMRFPWVFGFFSGRPEDSYTTNENFGTPYANDFDKKIQDNHPEQFWINMGMVVSILNYFSALESGGKNGKNMFEVDIQNSILGAHPNLISCDQRVLIPNSQAPKFLYGKVGILDNTHPSNTSTLSDSIGKPNLKEPYTYQVVYPKPVAGSIPNQVLQQTFFQQDNFCYRDDLDSIINYNRYRSVKATNVGEKFPIISYSFPSRVDASLPDSPRGLHANQLEHDYSGLLSNIYISFSLLKEAVEQSDESNISFPDIYRYILQVLMNSVDGFWDLSLVEVENIMTITDKNFIGKFALDQQGDRVYSFDYSDADSIIKSLKFRPELSDAQATRVIYGEVNNKDSKFKYLDKNDVLDYMFRDAVIGTPEDKSQGDAQGDLNKRRSAVEQQKDLVRTVQTINSTSDDRTLQMSLNCRRGGVNPPTPPLGTPVNMPEIIKLVMPSPQLLRMLLNDEDFENNGRYCAVQPGIILEITLMGIGGLRTFQYFLVKNLPEPYSDRNIIFRITDVQQTLETGNWETTIRAQPLPLRGYIKKRLTGPHVGQPGGWLPDKSISAITGSNK